MMIFADKRYKRKDYTDKMPTWIRHQLFNEKDTCHKDLSTDITVQVARATRPLVSVSKNCDNDLTAHFNKHQARIKDKNGKVVCTFQRQGGL